MLCVLGCSGFAWAGLGCVLISRLLVLGFEVFVRRVRADGGTDTAPILFVRRPWSYPCVVLGRVWVVFLVCFRPAGGDADTALIVLVKLLWYSCCLLVLLRVFLERVCVVFLVLLMFCVF